MTFQYMSDLHLEFGELFLPQKTADVLVLAGDIVTAHGILNTKSKRKRYKDFFDYVSSLWKHVIYVTGNHEYYSNKRHNTDQVISTFLSKYPNVHFLRNSSVTLEGVTFVGGTLWTDFFGGSQHYKNAVAGALNDYHVTVLTTDVTEMWHYRTKEAIKIAARESDKVVVVTHHAPSQMSSLPMYAGDPVNAGYYSNLESFILDLPSIKAWVHGHMHNTSDYFIGETRVLANPRGYPHEVNRRFDDSRVFRVT